MPQISKQIINTKIKKELDNLYQEAFSSLKGDSALAFVQDLFSPTEKIMIAKRISIAHFLILGYDYRAISSLLKVSTGTINRVNNVLNINVQGYRKIIKSLHRKKQSLKSLGTLMRKLFVDKSLAITEFRD